MARNLEIPQETQENVPAEQDTQAESTTESVPTLTAEEIADIQRKREEMRAASKQEMDQARRKLEKIFNDNGNIETGESDEYGDRLSDYLTGMRPEDPRMPERLVNDHYMLREKYHLPDEKMADQDMPEYERRLKEIAKKAGVKIKGTDEAGKFFKEYPMAGAAHFEETKEIAVNIDRSSAGSYRSSLDSLEHEVIHALQNKNTPDMPIEAMEYEAYIAANLNVKAIQEESPDRTEGIRAIFQYAIGSSIENWYKEESSKQGMEIKPVWNNKEYFLKRDEKK